MSDAIALMESLPYFLGVIIGVALVVSLVMAAIGYVFLPFAIYGIKKRLDRIAESVERIR